MSGSPLGYSTNTGLAAEPEIDAQKSPDVYAEFVRTYNAITALQAAIDKYTGAQSEDRNYWTNGASNPTSYFRLQGITKIYATAGEDIPQSAACTLVNSTGVLNIKRATSAAGAPTPAYAYCNTQGGVKSGAIGEFITSGMVPLAGAVPGTQYYLSSSPGGYTSTKPSASGTIAQLIGVGTFSGYILFNGSFNWTVNP
jgi:hypothetical protein